MMGEGTSTVPAEKSSSIEEKKAETAASSLLNKEVDPSCYRYEGDKYFYTDPSSKTEFEWNENKKEWFPSCRDIPNFSSKDYKYDGDTYFYTDKKLNKTYKWDKEKNEWTTEIEKVKTGGINITNKKPLSDDEEFDEGESRPEIKRLDMSQGVYGFDGKHHTYTDSKDGTIYLWDNDVNAWFPKVDDDFLAQYQMNYGFNPPELQTTSGEMKSEVKPQPTQETLKRKQDATWFEVDEKNNTKVYVSNLPLDLTEQEFIDLMQKCGLVMKDMDSGKYKIKMYTDPESKNFKGDALCTYIKVESVELALKILDGYDIKGQKISVERAKFQMKGNAYDPKLKPKKKSKKQVEKLKKMQQKLFDWRPDKLRGERGRNERVVIIKNFFDSAQFDKEVGLVLEYQQDLREEASKCGNVKKVVIYDRHPEGVAQVTFKEAEAADACIQLLNNRWFGQRQITAETWDGKTKYMVAETEEQKAERLKKWEKHLEEEKKTEKAKEDLKMEEDEDTRSSAGSLDDTDEETEPKEKNKQ